MTWYQAKDFCEEKGGHLVTITSQEEQAAIQSILLYSGKKKFFTERAVSALKKIIGVG